MGKPTGFIEWTRIVPHKRAVAERLRDWREVEAPQGILEADALRTQGGRCMDCGVPFCTNGCPLGNPIPEFADLVYRGRWHDAHKKLAATNDFPEFTGRLCTAPCEGSCVLGIDGAPVTIEAIEKAIAERAFAEGWVKPAPRAPRTGKRVAIVGSGPAGLAAANQLDRAGHDVTVYEAATRAGGLLRFGIPDFKLEKHVIDRRLALLEEQGIGFVCGVRVGKDVSWDQLRADHDAVVLAIGAMKPRELAVPGRELPGVVPAMDYLCDQNDAIALGRPAIHDVRGKRVIILGGGDTGSDCLGTAHRQGAASVMQIELMPAPPPARGTTNPWPEWPLIFRTSSSQEEGGQRVFAFRTTHLTGTGALEALHGTRVDDNSALTLPVDVLILAMGFVGPELPNLDVARDARGIKTDTRGATSLPGVYCAGDARRGASLIVWAIAEGREIARTVDEDLRGGASCISTVSLPL